jgi:hypothetical protein
LLPFLRVGCLFHSVVRYTETGEPIKLTLLDHAGQDIFYTLHHLFISRFGVYVVVFNMKWLWDNPSNMQNKAEESLSFLRFWLNSIFVHAQSPLGYEGREMAPIILVGTHKDVVSDPVDHSDIHDLLWSKLEHSPAWKHVVHFKEGGTREGPNRGLCFFPVACKRQRGVQDAVLQQLRVCIQEQVVAEQYVKCMVPLEWIRVMDRLQQVKDKFASFDSVARIAQECGVPSVPGLSLEDELVLLLKLLSEYGLLMHHSEPSLRNLVILDPFAFLVDPASRIICNHKYKGVVGYHKPKQIEAAEQSSQLRNAVIDLRERAFLRPDLLKFVWNDDMGADMIPKLKRLMAKYGLIVPVIDESGDSGSCIVPSLLKAKTFPSMQPQQQNDQVKHFFCVFGQSDFMERWKRKNFLSLHDNAAKEGFLPKGLFIRIAGKMFSDCQTVYGLSIEEFELNVNFFSVMFGGHTLQLRNFEHSNVIEIQVSGQHMSSLIDRVTNVIQTAVNEMIPRLKIGIVIPSNGGHFDAHALQKHAVFYDSLLRMLSIEQPNFCVEPGVPLSFLRFKERFHNWLPIDATDFNVQFDICVLHFVGDTFSCGLAANLSRRMNAMSPSIATFYQDERTDTYGKFPDEIFAHVAARCRVLAVVLCRAAVDELKSLRAESSCSSAAGQLAVRIVLLYNLLETSSLHACRPITFGDSTDGVVTSAFDEECIRELPSVCVRSVVERTQVLLRHAHKREAPDLSRITIRGAVQRLTGMPNRDYMQPAVVHGGNGGGGQEMAQYMKVTLDGLSSSLSKLHNHWKERPQEGNASTAAMDIDQLKEMINQGTMKQEEYLKHIISIQAEQRKKQIPCVLLFIPDQKSGANIIDKVQNWMQSKVMDQLLLVMQCEMRVAKDRLPACRHGVLWHRPEPPSPSDPPYGYKFSQPKQSMQKLKNVLRHVTTVVKVRFCPPRLLSHGAFSCSPRLTCFLFRCWVLQRACSASTSSR